MTWYYNLQKLRGVGYFFVVVVVVYQHIPWFSTLHVLKTGLNGFGLGGGV